MNSLCTIILFVCVINAVFGRYYYDNDRAPWKQYNEKRDDRQPSFLTRDSFRQDNEHFPRLQDSRFARFHDFRKEEPNPNRPLPIPLKDAIRYVRQYGPHADMLRAKEKKVMNYKFSDAVNHFRNKNKRSEEPKCQRRTGDPTCKRDVNGCGSGFTASLPLFYREEFTPCCNKHDVCYDCGVTRHWTREQCDNKFYEDMENTCSCLYPSWYQYPAYKTCKLWASTLYAVVDVFSASYFGTKVKDACKSKCILPYGSPQISLLG
uniref:Uncharacterized protein n=1 Tax=Clytia hemisphaerica TaxID=252671 RepID=A0A7M5V2Y7_9CNID